MMKIIKSLCFVVILIQLSQVFATPPNATSPVRKPDLEPVKSIKLELQETRNATSVYLPESLREDFHNYIQAAIQKGLDLEEFNKWNGHLIRSVHNKNLDKLKKDEEEVLTQFDEILPDNVKIIFCYWSKYNYDQHSPSRYPMRNLLDMQDAAHSAGYLVLHNQISWIARKCNEFGLTSYHDTLKKYLNRLDPYTPILAILQAEKHIFEMKKKTHNPDTHWEAIVYGIQRLP